MSIRHRLAIVIIITGSMTAGRAHAGSGWKTFHQPPPSPARHMTDCRAQADYAHATVDMRNMGIEQHSLIRDTLSIDDPDFNKDDKAIAVGIIRLVYGHPDLSADTASDLISQTCVRSSSKHRQRPPPSSPALSE